MQRFINYLESKGIDNWKFTKQGNLNFSVKGRKFQLSKTGWFRSWSKNPTSGSHGAYLVFKTFDSCKRKKVTTKDGYSYWDYNDQRDGVQFKVGCDPAKNFGAVWKLDSEQLIARIEKAELF